MKKRFYILGITGILLALAYVTTVFGQKGEVIEQEIRFVRGKSSATVKGVVADRLDSHIFYLTARAGQTMSVTMNSARPMRDAHLVVNFPLTDAGENETLSGKRKYVFTLPRSGKYEIYIEAIRDKIPYTITVTIK
jgi:hypothetical protein